MAKKQNYLGIDLGGSSLKIVELASVNNRPQLVTYGYIDETYNIIKDESKTARTELAKHLRELIKTSRVTTDKVVSALPSFSVFSSIISLPTMNKKELISAVRWEAKKFVPIPLEEMILDWEILKDESGHDVGGKNIEAKNDKKDNHKESDKDAKSSAPDETKKKDSKNSTEKKKMTTGNKGVIKVLLTAAPKTLVNRYVELFKEINLQLVGLETESFAIERSLVGNDRNPVMVIDIGNKATSIIIFADGVPILNRSIDVGGAQITKKLIETMGLSDQEAEQFKRDMGIQVARETMDNLPKPISAVINSIMNEIRYILNIYQNQNRAQISRIVLSGGSAFLANLTNYIEKVFNVKSYVGDPWARVVHPVEIDDMLREIGPRMTVAIGLGMREII